MTQTQVEAFASETTELDNWKAIDKQAVFGIGEATPNPCVHSDLRQHWFLIR